MTTSASTVVNRLRSLMVRYRPHALAVIGVSATIILILSQVFTSVQDVLVESNAIPFVILLVVIDIAAVQSTYSASSGLEPSVNQDEALPQLCAAVERCRRETVDLIEYAGMTTLPLIRAIQREQVPLRLLMKHPETVEGVQRSRMIATLDTLYDSIFDDPSAEFEARCYRAPYSLRGRRLGSQLLEVGWLTPDVTRKTAYGHANPSLLIDLNHGEHAAFASFFERTFSDLWDATDTEDAQAVLTRMREP